MAITVTSYGAAFPATTFLSEYLLTTSTTFLSGFETGSRSQGTTYYETRDSTRRAISSTTSESTILGTNNGNTVTPVEFESLIASDANSVGLFVFNTAIVSTAVGTTEVFVEDDPGYFEEQTFAQTQTTRNSSTATTTTATSFTTSRDSADEVSFYTATTTKSVTTSTTATATFETFGTSSVSSSRLSGGVESTEYVYAAPDEVLWVASAAAFNSRAVLTAVGSTATSHSRKLDNVSLADITTASGAVVTWPESTQGTLSKTESFNTITFGPATKTIIRSLTTFPGLFGNVVSQFSTKLPHVTDTYTLKTVAVTSGSYVESSYSLVAPGGSGVASEQQTASVTFISRFPVQRAQRGLTFEQIFTKAASTAFAYTRAVSGYSRVTQSGASVEGNSLISTAPTQWAYSIFDNPVLLPDFSSVLKSPFIVHGVSRRTSGFMTYTDNVSGWITGLTVPTDSSLATTVTFARHRRDRNVLLPGSFEKYTVSKNSFTYTRSTAAESGTTSTTSSTLLALAGQSTLVEDGGFFGSGQTIGGGAQTGETIFANVVGLAKVNNSVTSNFGSALSSTTNTAGSASFVNAMATLWAAPATNTIADIVTQRNITSMV